MSQKQKEQPKLNLEATLSQPNKVRRVRSNFMPGQKNLRYEKKKDKRPELILLDKVGNEKYPEKKVAPNQALTVKDIMSKYMRGLPVDETKLAGRPVWPGEDMNHNSPDLSKIANMDRMERKDLARSAKFQVPGKPEPKAEPQSPSAKDNPDPRPGDPKP